MAEPSLFIVMREGVFRPATLVDVMELTKSVNNLNEALRLGEKKIDPLSLELIASVNLGEGMGHASREIIHSAISSYMKSASQLAKNYSAPYYELIHMPSGNHSMVTTAQLYRNK